LEADLRQEVIFHSLTPTRRNSNLISTEPRPRIRPRASTLGIPPASSRHAREQDPEEVREFEEKTLPEAEKKAEQEDGELHFADEAGIKVHDQIGTSHAPVGQTPVLEFPKTRIQQILIASVTPGGKLT
jgi:hypothetical protein